MAVIVLRALCAGGYILRRLCGGTSTLPCGLATSSASPANEPLAPPYSGSARIQPEEEHGERHFRRRGALTRGTGRLHREGRDRPAGQKVRGEIDQYAGIDGSAATAFTTCWARGTKARTSTRCSSPSRQRCRAPSATGRDRGVAPANHLGPRLDDERLTRADGQTEETMSMQSMSVDPAQVSALSAAIRGGAKHPQRAGHPRGRWASCARPERRVAAGVRPAQAKWTNPSPNTAAAGADRRARPRRSRSSATRRTSRRRGASRSDAAPEPGVGPGA